jgi:hypothetical protein
MNAESAASALQELGLGKSKESPKRILEFLSPMELSEYTPPPGHLLVGRNHIVLGSAFVIGGAPGVGKSRASVALAVAGATQHDWFGLTVHRPFRTLILQNENGRHRLKDEFSELPCKLINEHIRVSAPPAFGFAFESLEFAERLAEEISAFSPDVVLLDPWNAAAKDDKAGDYLATFKAIRSVIPQGDGGPALGIVAHTRKPKPDERSSGRGLLNLLAGSYVLGSVPRCAFVIQAASEDPEDSRVVFTCCKNNDGPMGGASAWERRNGLFAPVENFDWKEFRGGVPKSDRVTLKKEDVAAVFGNGAAAVTLKRATELLQEQTGCGQSAAYAALGKGGRFKDRLQEGTDGLYRWIP